MQMKTQHKTSLHDAQHLPTDLFRHFFSVKEKLDTIYSNNQIMPSVEELFPSNDYDIFYFDYEFDYSKSFKVIKKEMEDLTYLLLTQNTKNKKYIGNYAYCLNNKVNYPIFALISDIFAYMCIDLTNLVIGGFNYPKVSDKTMTATVRCCIFVSK